MSLKIVISYRVNAGLTTGLCIVNKSVWHVVNNWLGVRLCKAVKGLREKTHTESLCQGLCCPLTAGQPSIPGCPPPLITAMTSQRDPDTVSISGQISLYILHHCTISTWWASGVILECVQILKVQSSLKYVHFCHLFLPCYSTELIIFSLFCLLNAIKVTWHNVHAAPLHAMKVHGDHGCQVLRPPPS